MTPSPDLTGHEAGQPDSLAAAIAAARQPAARLIELGSDELAAHWKALQPLTGRAPLGSIELTIAAGRMLAELTVRDVGAQRLRAVLEPLQADAWDLDGGRRDQADHALQAAQAYTAARILHRIGRSERDHIDVVFDAVRQAGITGGADIALGLAGPGAFPAAVPERDHYLDSWIAAHPAAGRALVREQRAAASAAARADSAAPSPRAQARAVYWRLRADRSAAAYGVLARLSEPFASAPAGPYGALMRNLADDAHRAVVPVVFGSEQRAADFIAASAASLEPTPVHLDDGGPGQTAERPQEPAAALRRAGQELLRLFPNTISVPHADGARVRAAADKLVARTTARQQMRSQPGPPTAHDLAQRAAAAPLVGQGGAAPS